MQCDCLLGDVLRLRTWQETQENTNKNICTSSSFSVLSLLYHGNLLDKKTFFFNHFFTTSKLSTAISFIFPDILFSSCSGKVDLSSTETQASMLCKQSHNSLRLQLEEIAFRIFKQEMTQRTTSWFKVICSSVEENLIKDNNKTASAQKKTFTKPVTILF